MSSARSERRATIVAGLPRSGTSLMMQMLYAGGLTALTDDVRAADDDNPRGYFEYEPVKRTERDPSWLHHAEGKVVKAVYRLLYDFPSDRSYRVVFLRRDMDEVLASQAKMLERRGESPGSLPDADLRRVFEAELDEFDRWIAGQSNFEILYVDYRDVLSDPRAAAERISAFLGEELDLGAMAAAVDPALYRNRAEIRNRGDAPRAGLPSPCAAGSRRG